MKILFNSHTHGYEWLSNFSMHSVLDERGEIFPSVEHAYQASKTGDHDVYSRIRACRTPGAAKRLGKNLELRPDWDQIKIPTMEALIASKFERWPELTELLLETGDVPLLHFSPWDTFWGVDGTGRGTNHLGRIIMERRAHLRSAPVPAILF